jgi:hypothetical protein
MTRQHTFWSPALVTDAMEELSLQPKLLGEFPWADRWVHNEQLNTKPLGARAFHIPRAARYAPPTLIGHLVVSL